MSYKEAIQRDPSPRTWIERVFVFPKTNIDEIRRLYKEFLGPGRPLYRTHGLYEILPVHKVHETPVHYQSAMIFRARHVKDYSWDQKFDLRRDHMQEFAIFLLERDVPVQEMYKAPVTIGDQLRQTFD